LQTPATTLSPAAAALRHRALTGMLFNALACPTRPEGFNFWQGYAKALADLANGTGDKLSSKDGGSGYQLPGYVAVAARCLGDDVYRLTRAEVLDRLASAGIEVATDALAALDVVAAHQLENGAVATVDLHDEHAADAVVVGDGSLLNHGSASGGTLNVIVAEASPLTHPAIGQHWPGQGGVYVGIVDNEHLIACTAPEASFTSSWGTYGENVEGAKSCTDGRANTASMAAAGSACASRVLALEVDGHKDLFIPSQAQLQHAYQAAPEAFEEEGWHWSSTQVSRHLAFAQYFENGSSHWGSKDDEFRVRAFRGLPLDHLNTSKGGAL